MSLIDDSLILMAILGLESGFLNFDKIISKLENREYLHLQFGIKLLEISI